MILEDAELSVYFSGEFHHAAYADAVEKAAALRVHADGVYPKILIEGRRPHESGAVHEYRQTIWQPITKPYFGKVLNSLSKIRRSAEWSVRFPNEPPKQIAADEDLQSYINSKLPRHTSLTNWAFSVLLREYTIDANAWVAVLPEETEVEENVYLTPRPIIFRADQIIDFDDDFLVVLSDEKSIYSVEGVDKTGNVYYVITDTVYQRWEQINDKPQYEVKWQYEHTIGQLPAFQMRGVVLESNSIFRLSETRLAPMLPRLDEAVREYSDLQAEVVQHIHSEKWEIGQKECVKCHGKGRMENIDNGSIYICETCNGSGWEPRGPYTTLMVEKGMAGEQTSPIPPVGYVQKSVEIVKVQDGRVDGHISKALAAVNMEFLMNVPLAESGIAKAYDADETNNFVHSVAEDIVTMLDSVVFYITELRYGFVVSDKQERAAMLPVINVPDRFDLFSAAMIEQELNGAKQNNLSPIIVNAMELSYVAKKFDDDPAMSAFVTSIFKLDPLPGVSEENKVLMLQNGGITKETYVASCNIYSFVSRAAEEKGIEFFVLPVGEQKKIINGYAQKQVADSTARSQIMTGFQQQQNSSTDENSKDENTDKAA